MARTVLVTKITLAVVTLALIIYDIWVAVEPTRGDTISEVLGLLAVKYPAISYAWGVLTGHLFLHRSWASYPFKTHRRYAGIAFASVVPIAANMIGFPAQHISVWLLFGALAAYMFWPQFRENFKTD